MKTDEKLREALAAQVDFWLGRSAENLQIAVKDGEVTIRGSVPSYAEKMNCLEMVQRAGGVTAVADEVAVRIPEIRKRRDAEIAAEAEDVIKWLTTIPPDSIKISVHSGKLILEGTVDDPQRKEEVDLVVRNIPGITGIMNLIVPDLVSLHPNAGGAIEASFERPALFETETNRGAGNSCVTPR